MPIGRHSSSRTATEHEAPITVARSPATSCIAPMAATQKSRYFGLGISVSRLRLWRCTYWPASTATGIPDAEFRPKFCGG